MTGEVTGVKLGETELTFTEQSADEINAALIAANGCSASELLALLYSNGQKGLVAQGIVAMCDNPDDLALSEIAVQVDADAHSAVANRLRTIIAELDESAPAGGSEEGEESTGTDDDDDA